jgi:hypothetical protein
MSLRDHLGLPKGITIEKGFSTDTMCCPDTLRCPNCGGNNLRQLAVRVFDRSEDDTSTTVTTVRDGLSASHLVPRERCGNPSSRRHGVTIRFDCETCDARPELELAQHKGLTHIGWHTPIQKDPYKQACDVGDGDVGNPHHGYD